MLSDQIRGLRLTGYDRLPRSVARLLQGNWLHEVNSAKLTFG